MKRSRLRQYAKRSVICYTPLLLAALLPACNNAQHADGDDVSMEVKTASSEFKGWDAVPQAYQIANLFHGNNFNILLYDAVDNPTESGGVTPETRPRYEYMIQTAIMMWVKAIEPVLGPGVSLISQDEIKFVRSSDSPTFVVNWSEQNGRASGGSGAMQLFVGDGLNTVLHEFGHALGLNDTYTEIYPGWHCAPGQEDSVMCGAEQLTRDDRAAIQEAFCAGFPDKCNRRWLMPTAWCDTVNRQLYAADFNGDKRTDLLCHDKTNGNKWIIYADAYGHFSGTTWYSAMNWCYGESIELSLGDFNGDGRTDLLCRDKTNGTIWREFADANGQFAVTLPAIPTPWCVGTNTRVRIGDFNGDGRDDIFCLQASPAKNLIGYATTDGQFSAVPAAEGTTCQEAGDAELLVGDFNGDYRDDILCRSFQPSPTGNLAIDLASSSGQFEGVDWTSISNSWVYSKNWCAGSNTQAFIGDFDGNGRSDMICHVTDTGDKHIQVANAQGSFLTTWRYWHMQFCKGPNEELLLADLDANRISDMICHDRVTGAISTWTSGSSPHNDFNYDGYPDLLWYNATTNEFSVWLLQGDRHLSETQPDLPVGPVGLTGVAPGWQMKGGADFNRDGNTDFLWHKPDTGDVAVWFMSGPYLLAASQPTALISPARSATEGWAVAGLADFDGDGNVDILWFNSTNRRLYIAYLNGTTQVGQDVEIGPSGASTVPNSWDVRTVTDLDGDGKLEIVFHDAATGKLPTWLLDGSTHPWNGELFPGIDPGWTLAGADDFNADRSVDLLLYSPNTGELRIRYYERGNYSSEVAIGPNSILPEWMGWKLLPR